jgi:energy-coupling factor transporter transmembrane protein EcfT
MSAWADGQYSVARSVVLHLLPGALIIAFYALLAPVVRSFGFPSLMAIFLAILFVLIPFELGYLLYRS